MSDSKLKQITTESLLDALNDKVDSKPIEIDYSNQVLQFIKDNDIQPGEDPVKKRLLFIYFKRFYNNNINHVEFHSIMRVILPTHYGSYYIKNAKNNITLRLLYKLDEGNRTINSKYYRKFNLFIDKYNIKSGISRYSIDFLYNLYKLYMKSINKRAIPSITFARLLYKTFKYVKTDKGNYILLNKINLNKQELELVNQMIVEYEQTKKNKKGNKKVPRT